MTDTITRAPRSRRRALRGALTASAVVLLALAGCSTGDTEETGSSAAETSAPAGSSGTESAEAAAWPRTVELDEHGVEIQAEPRRIVALSTETGDIALDLVGHERLAAIPAASLDPATGNATEEAEQVETTLPSGTSPDPEQILSLQPDLVLMTGRHEGEDDAAAALRETGVPALVFSSADFNDPQAVADSTRLLGEALGAEDAAQERAGALEESASRVEDAVADLGERPRVLSLMARGGKVMVSGSESTLNTLAEQAGGDPVARERSWRAAMPADPEVIAEAAPDVVLIEDFRGAGMEPFEDLLSSPALAGVPAVAEDEVHLVPSHLGSGSAGLKLGEGLTRVAEILHPGAL
jgi:iron complex transport system substrate-binding protein